MAQYKIGVVVGSLRKDSFNNKLAHALTKLAPAEFTFKFIPINELPLYNQDEDGHPTEVVKRFKSEINDMNAILFVTPEYNRSIPGVLKNAIDQASRPYGQSVWTGKAAGVIGTSIGTIGTALAQQHLRNILAYLDMPTMGQPEAFVYAKEGLFDDKGNIGPDSKEFMQKWMNSFVAWVKKHVD